MRVYTVRVYVCMYLYLCEKMYYKCICMYVSMQRMYTACVCMCVWCMYVASVDRSGDRGPALPAVSGRTSASGPRGQPLVLMYVYMHVVAAVVVLAVVR